MLGEKEAVATIAVKDLSKAKDFYTNTLGLNAKSGEDKGGIIFTSGTSSVFVYQSEFAGTNKATTASWGVGEEIKAIVGDLQDKGVKFEVYSNMPNVTMDGVIHVMGNMKAAWFKDPDGNILNLVNQM